MRKTLFTVLLLLVATLSFAAAGRIFGIVTSSKTGEALQMAAVKVTELKTGSFSDKSGKFLIADVPAGDYTVKVDIIGYEPQEKKITVTAGESTTINFEMKVQAVTIGGSSVSANRAVKRETPIAFTNIDEDEISDKYTTEDMPQLLDDVPGLFSSTTGMGDAEITMRGFEADKIQVLINGIPVNDPESQKVYWSNWTGLTSNVKSVQVQKGAGSSLYGSGAFGGSLNIETMGSTQHSETTIRTSYAGYTTEGDVANGDGEIESYYPYNYNVIGKYNSGALYGGKFNFSLMAERKVGDYYIEGTNYRGWSFGFDTQTVTSGHKISTSFLGAPQEHNQVYFKSDRNLMDTLGREYNRNNHEYQENYYFKPQFSVRDEWQIDDKSLLMTNFFVTKGNGGGKYMSQDKFDVNTGEVTYNDGFLDKDDPYAYENLEFGKHALWLYENYGVVCEGFNPADTVMVGPFPVETATYNGMSIAENSGLDFYSSPSRYDYSWRNNNISDHMQFGMNTYFDHNLNEAVDMVFGGELRSWEGNHYRKIEQFRHYDASDTLTYVETFDEVERGYDYTTHVLNMSAFARFKVKPMENLNFMIDGQIARYASEIEENPIEIYDIGTGEPTGVFRYDTKDFTEVVDGDTIPKFNDDDYEKVYSFFSPKFGVNYNISEYFNIRSNYSIAYKEPRTSEWYGYDGPDTRQLYTKNVVLYDEFGNPYGNEDEEHFYGELNPEKINTLEFGIGYDGVNFDIDANYYVSDYTDKIESVDVPIKENYYNSQTDSIEVYEFDAGLVINAGEARHQGLELSVNGDIDAIDASASMTLAHNRWTEMNVEEIFGMSAEEMKDKVVPYSPEIMANFNVGYTLEEIGNGKIRFGLTGKYWDGYYANYENEYYANYVWDETAGNEGDYVAEESSLTSSELPYFFELGADIKYSFQIAEKDAFVKVGFNNITNRDNYSSARVASDYNRGYFDENGDFQDDYLNSNPTMYVTPSPLFNMYMTTEIKF